MSGRGVKTRSASVLGDLTDVALLGDGPLAG
jgi:hypothetical protein